MVDGEKNNQKLAILEFLCSIGRPVSPNELAGRFSGNITNILEDSVAEKHVICGRNGLYSLTERGYNHLSEQKVLQTYTQ